MRVRTRVRRAGGGGGGGALVVSSRPGTICRREVSETRGTVVMYRYGDKGTLCMPITAVLNLWALGLGNSDVRKLQVVEAGKDLSALSRP